jgi:hypothetical protein
VSSVKLIVACPSRSLTTLGLTPACSASLAQEWRKPCSVIRGTSTAATWRAMASEIRSGCSYDARRRFGEEREGELLLRSRPLLAPASHS